MRKELKEYLPPVLLKTLEFPLICLAEQPEFDGIAQNADAVLDAQFVLTAPEIGLVRYESILGITPKDTDSLEERRLRVLSRLNSGLIYGAGWLIRKADAAFGEGNYTLACDVQQFLLKIMTDVQRQTALTALRDEIRPAIPANLLLKVFAAVPVVSIPENPGNLLLKCLQFAFRFSYYEQLIDLSGKKRLDGRWILCQIPPGFGFPVFRCSFDIKEKSGWMSAAMRMNINAREKPEDLTLASLQMAFRIPYYTGYIELDGKKRLDGGWTMRQARPGFAFPVFRCGAGVKGRNMNYVKFSQSAYRVHIQNQYGMMPATLQKGKVLKMDGSFSFDGTRKFNGIQSIKENI